MYAQVPGFKKAWNELATEHRKALKEEGVVGATLAFVYDGEIIAVDYYGMEDVAGNRPVDEHTIYHWASITKTFTGVAIMQLRDHGLIELDDPIIKYVPELCDVYNPFGSMQDITIAQIMSHSSGFRGPTWPWDGGKDWQPFEPTEWSQFVAMIPYTRIFFEPGSKYMYSNPAVIFLGQTIERESGNEFEAYIDANIFELLGMKNAYFDITPWHLLDDRSNNYKIIDGKPVANGLDFNTGITVSNSGLNASVADMAKWVSFLMNAPQSKQAVYKEVLAHQSLQEMWQPQVPVPDSLVLAPVTTGLSFFLYQKNGHKIVGHSGSQKAFRSFIFFDPKANIGLIGVYNTAGGDETGADTGMILKKVRLKAMEKFFPLFW